MSVLPLSKNKFASGDWNDINIRLYKLGTNRHKIILMKHCSRLYRIVRITGNILVTYGDSNNLLFFNWIKRKIIKR
jgi:hypothetical protein